MNSYILTAFFQACCRVSLLAAQVEAAFSLAASYRSTEMPSAFVYTALLTFCAKKAPERALDVWHALQEVMLPCLPCQTSSVLLFMPLEAALLALCANRCEERDGTHLRPLLQSLGHVAPSQH